ncbi:hypothetical protein LINGRAHAP2_LOCUS11134, partial [Linum grandiflorum]
VQPTCSDCRIRRKVHPSANQWPHVQPTCSDCRIRRPVLHICKSIIKHSVQPIMTSGSRRNPHRG